MKYFIDTEFIEGFHKPLFGKRRHFIDLISIGIVAEDGRSYYAISNDFSEKDADQWVKDNVIHPIFKEACNHPSGLTGFEKRFVKSNNQIADEIRKFFRCWRDQLFWRAPENIQVYGYYSDYDWVVFCSLFGRMVDLPKGFPMYCIDLKQTLDNYVTEWRNKRIASETNSINFASWDTYFKSLKNDPEFPKQTNEHNALEDAKWNLELYLYLEAHKLESR